ncbi:MAG: zinc-ribbon domain-containing protein [Deltaproteobacteria bacterium]|nr:zinc-ribbon domain-containing protein [Deltaproteobacteria bacterium]
MIIQCGKCSTKFRLDDSRITGGGVKVRCTKCQEVFIVTPPPPPKTPREVCSMANPPNPSPAKNPRKRGR